MSEDKKKEGEFDPGAVCEIYDDLHNHAFALRAFGALLRSSDLADFADQSLSTSLKPDIDVEKDNLRWGLKQIIDLYLAHQERILNEHVDKYHKSDFWLMKRANSLLNMVEQGAFKTREMAINETRGAISLLDVVIARDGETKDQAKGVKAKGIDILKWLDGKKAANA